jgi:RimJ/RimL family protein N-acetyltransferase
VSAIPLPGSLESERLVLRPWHPGDAEALREALAESVQHLRPWIPWATPEAPTPEETESLLAGWIAQREAGENFIYAVFDRETGRLVGGIGLYARIGPDALEVGYWIRRSDAGRGLATEATHALTHAGFGVPGISRLEIHTDPRNLASRRVPEKLGYELTALREGVYRTPDGERRDTAIYELGRSTTAGT